MKHPDISAGSSIEQRFSLSTVTNPVKVPIITANISINHTIGGISRNTELGPPSGMENNVPQLA
jgi:hypothetical protein